jgi:hypothetical protein
MKCSITQVGTEWDEIRLALSSTSATKKTFDPDSNKTFRVFCDVHLPNSTALSDKGSTVPAVTAVVRNRAGPALPRRGAGTLVLRQQRTSQA